MREQGLATLSMRDPGARVGMRAQSLYVYFPSKHAIYGEMLPQGNLEVDLTERMAVRDSLRGRRERTPAAGHVENASERGASIASRQRSWMRW